ncbi:MAG: S8 family peptidase [Candidatus Nanoarchaeia archaeon]
MVKKKIVLATLLLLGMIFFTSFVHAQVDYLVFMDTPALQPVAVNSLQNISINITNSQDTLCAITIYLHYNESELSFTSSTQQTPNCENGLCLYNFTNTSLNASDSSLITSSFELLQEQVTSQLTAQVIAYNDTTFLEKNATAQINIGDKHEYDSEVQNATSKLVDGSLTKHSLFPITDQDWFSFSAQQGAQYRFETLDTKYPVDTLLEVIDTDEVSVLASQDDVVSSTFLRSQLYWTAPTNDTYYVKITDGGAEQNGDYSFFIQELSNISISILNITNTTPEKNSFFTVTANVSCGGVGCTNFSIYLDPQEQKTPPTSVKNPKEAFELDSFDNLSSNQLYPVIIRLQDADNSTLLSVNSTYRDFRSTTDLLRKEKIRQAQEAVKNQIPQERFHLFSSTPQSEVVQEFNTLPSLSMKVTKSVLQDLQSNPYVDSFFLDVPLHVQTDTSVPLINADYVWSESFNDDELQGQGQTVCVVDTGIDYTHDDFGGNSSFPNEKIIGGWDFVNDDADPMDDQGHGTHIAGIIASEDSTYTGVAPQSKLVAVKACSNMGSCSTTDVLSGIDWCIAHADEFNISVISLSLGHGSTRWQTHCSGIIPDAINYARNQGFFVAVASGNDGWNDGISYPACAQGAFSVGTIQSDDQTIRYNRGNLTDILAPGYHITATSIGAGHETRSGTSMSTPFVAGAAAILNQYYYLRQGTQLHATTISQALKNNGPSRLDSSTGESYPRLDVLSAYANSVLPKGIISTTVGATPFYTTSQNPQNITLTANNWTLLSWDVNATGQVGDYDFFAFASRDGEYHEINSSIWSVSIADSVAPQLNFTFENNSWKNTSLVDFNFDVVDMVDAQVTCSLYINDSLVNTSLVSNGHNSFSYDVDDGVYTTHISCQDSYSNTNISESKTFFVDTVSPQLTFSNYSQNYSVENEPINISFYLSDDSQLQTPAYLSIHNQTLNLTNESNESLFLTTFTPPTLATYSWTTWATDAAMNNVSLQGSLVVGSKNVSSDISFSNESIRSLNYSLFSTQVDVQVNTSIIANFTVTYFEDEPFYVNSSLQGAPYFVRYDAQDSLSSVINWTRIELRYEQSDIYGLNESSLTMFRYNESNSSWSQLVNDSAEIFSLGQNVSQNLLWVNTSHYSTYALLGEKILCENNAQVPTSGCYYADVVYTSGYICSGSYSNTVCVEESSSSSSSSSSPSSGGSSGGLANSAPVLVAPENDSLENKTSQNSTKNVSRSIDTIKVTPLQVNHITFPESTLSPSKKFISFFQDELPFVLFVVLVFYLGFFILYHHKNLHRRV